MIQSRLVGFIFFRPSLILDADPHTGLKDTDPAKAKLRKALLLKLSYPLAQL